MAEEARPDGRGRELESALVVALAALAVVHLLLSTYAATRLYLGMDLRALHVSGTLWNAGVVPYFRAPDPGEPGPVNYPPLAIALFGLFARLPFGELRLVWWACQCLLLAGSVGLLARLAAPARLGAALWILLGLSTPVLVHFERGQIDLVVLLLVTAAAFVKHRHGADALPGFLIALATSVKLYPGLLAGYMLLRAPRMLAAFVVSLAALAAVTAAATGGSLFASFAGTLPVIGRPAALQRVPGGFAEIADGERLMAGAGFPTSDHAFVVRAAGEAYLYGTWAMGESQTAARHLWTALRALGADGLAEHALVLLALAVVGAAAVATLRGTAASHAECLALWTSAALLLVPRAWPFTYVVSLLPTVVLAGELARHDVSRSSPRLVLLLAALVVIHAPPLPVTRLLGWRSWPGCLAGGVVLFALLLAQVASGRGTPPAGAGAARA